MKHPATVEMLDYMEQLLREPELFMSVLMAHGERFVEVKTMQGLPLLSVLSLVIHAMVSLDNEWLV